METNLYIDKMRAHLVKAGKEIGREKLVEIKQEAITLLRSITTHTDKRELVFLTNTINSKAILTLDILSKDHKKANSSGEYLSRLLVPATNFT